MHQVNINIKKIMMQNKTQAVNLNAKLEVIVGRIKWKLCLILSARKDIETCRYILLCSQLIVKMQRHWVLLNETSRRMKRYTE